MTAFETLAVLLSIVALFAYVNQRLLKQPPAIALMALALFVSTLLVLLDRIGLLQVTGTATRILERIDLDDTLMHGMLGALLFAGALHINMGDLREQRLAILVLSVGGTMISTVLVGVLMHALLPLIGIALSLGECMLFGALISPTDPIAVLGILKQARIPKRMETQIAGESLFNDGVGVVIFLTVLGVVSRGADVSAVQIAGLFARETLGGAAFGLITGYVTYRLLRSIDHYQTELLLTLALVFGGYAVAEWLHLSAPIAAVVAGLLIGNQGRALAMSDVTRDHLDKFWILVDEILNAILFVLIGFELIRLKLGGSAVVAGLLAIPVVLAARLLSVAGPISILNRVVKFERGSIAILTWGGLRGGISVALALSIPSGHARDLIVTMTYFVVVFSIFAQGLTLARVARRYATAQ